MYYFIATLILICTSLIALSIGRYDIDYHQIYNLLIALIKGDPIDEKLRYILFEVRLPRVILAIFVGAALGVAGASFQAIFRNPLASPDILGVASGAGFGAALALLFGLNIVFLSSLAFAFGILTLFLTLIVARDMDNRIMIILGGIIISALFQSLISILKYIADPQDTLPAITYWLLGSLSISNISQLIFGCIVMTLGIVITLIFRWKHNLLMLDDNEAKSLGLNIRQIRILLILSSTLLVSSSVSICGIIGWVGLVIPHIARLIIGSNNALVLPFSMLIGAIFMIIIDTLSRSISSEEIPISILSAIIGAIFFIVILYRSKEVMKL